MAKSTKAGELTITRVFDVPPELIWKAWTHPDLFKKWYGPKRYSCPYCEIDLRVGGKYLRCMQSPKGEDYWSTGEFREIKPKDKLVYTESFSDKEGNVLPDSPKESKITVAFQGRDGKTNMTLQHAGIPEGEMQESVRIGWNQSFDKLAAKLKRRTQWS